MSGVGEALAIVSCVAGLIQAYDAGSRTIHRIKDRRARRQALPPATRLEESIEQSKQEIQALVASGTKRFGPSFEEGDTTAQLALFKITIATQNALLEQLTESRADDGVIDFEDCINASDRGRIDALIALGELFKRRLQEEEDAKNNALQSHNSGSDDSSLPTAAGSAPNVTQPSLKPSAPIVEQASRQSLSPPEAKRSLTLPNLFRRRSPTIVEPQPTRLQNVRPQPMVKRNDSSPLRPVGQRSPTGDSNKSPAVAHRQTDPRPSPKVHRPSSTSIDRHNVSTSPPGPTYSSSPTTDSSRRTSFSGSSSNFTPITSFGGCCKYAHFLRDGKVDKALGRQDQSATMGATLNIVYACKSVKCNFSGPAIPDKKGHFRIDDRIHSCRGVQYRWCFLFKSHVQQPDLRGGKQYRCIVCALLGDQSARPFQGHEALFEHLVGHQGAQVDNVTLEGPLSFSNDGVRPARDDFDINFLQIASPPVQPASAPPAALDESVVINVEVRQEIPKIEDISTKSAYADASEARELYFMPWGVR